MNDLENIKSITQEEAEKIFGIGFSIKPKIEINGEYHTIRVAGNNFTGRFSGSNFSVKTDDINLIDLMRRYMDYIASDNYPQYKIKVQLVIDMEGCFITEMDYEGKINFGYDIVNANIAFSK